ncbi:AraC family transcriptional regulator N-terminal domain-containing protein [Corallincola platygyrae]|uniref:AraC family transcriptional regulator N-terminal domain-containing protein n=1 Tax=Corallincola platygyrae TaxID=1193278 RepID=A0ABW4XT26_9GAMM
MTPEQRNRLVEQLEILLPDEGLYPSLSDGIELVRSNHVTSRQAIIYQPILYIVLQGSKQSYLGSECYRYDPLNFLALSVPLPMEGHVIEASPEKPYLAIKIGFTKEMILEMMVQVPAMQENVLANRGVCVSPLTERMEDALVRLIDALTDTNRASLLAPMVVKELIYYALLGPQGAQLAAFVTQGKYHERIAHVINYIQSHYADPLDIATLAGEASMSVSSLHQHFKSVTNVSPLQYIKQVRLHQAKELVSMPQGSISDAAYKVGYQSLSQFSREYKRMFGVPPSQSA